MLEEASVAITPGIDFGSHKPEQHVRFAYTTSLENLQKGVERIKSFLGML
jgi:aspartate/methionine/tyrosine aminotransferase